jgi:hypothetical protein
MNQLFNELVSMRATFLSQCRTENTELDELVERLTATGSEPAEQVWSTFTDSWELLIPAEPNSSIDRQAIESAKKSFKRLSDSATSKVSPDVKTGANVAQVVLGSYGLFMASLLEAEYRSAALLIYRTTELYPAAATQVFPPQAFSSDFRNIIRRSYHELRRTIKTHSNLEHTNLMKKLKRYPAQFIKFVFVSPMNYVYATVAGLAPLSDEHRPGSRRSSNYSSRVRAIYRSSMGEFDTTAMEKGWVIGRNHIQKQEMLLDQVKRITSIFNNHCLAASQDSKRKRRELESTETFGPQ